MPEIAPCPRCRCRYRTTGLTLGTRIRCGECGLIFSPGMLTPVGGIRGPVRAAGTRRLTGAGGGISTAAGADPAARRRVAPVHRPGSRKRPCWGRHGSAPEAAPELRPPRPP